MVWGAWGGGAVLLASAWCGHVGQRVRVFSLSPSWPLLVPSASPPPPHPPTRSNQGLHVADHDLQAHLRTLQDQLETVALNPKPQRMVGGHVERGGGDARQEGADASTLRPGMAAMSHHL